MNFKNRAWDTILRHGTLPNGLDCRIKKQNLVPGIPNSKIDPILVALGLAGQLARALAEAQAAQKRVPWACVDFRTAGERWTARLLPLPSGGWQATNSCLLKLCHQDCGDHGTAEIVAEHQSRLGRVSLACKVSPADYRPCGVFATSSLWWPGKLSVPVPGYAVAPKPEATPGCWRLAQGSTRTDSVRRAKN